MDKAFGWVGEIFQALLKVIPWLVIVPATHGGVAFIRGHTVREWKPGLHWFWPVATTYKLIVIVRQTQLIQSKVVMTKDLKTVLIGALVTYNVKDVVSAIAKIADLASDVMERAQGAIFIEVTKWTLDEIQARRLEFNEALAGRVAESLNDYGVEILNVQVTEFAPCRVIAISARGAMGQYSLWTGF